MSKIKFAEMDVTRYGNNFSEGYVNISVHDISKAGDGSLVAVLRSNTSCDVYAPGCKGNGLVLANLDKTFDKVTGDVFFERMITADPRYSTLGQAEIVKVQDWHYV